MNPFRFKTNILITYLMLKGQLQLSGYVARCQPFDFKKRGDGVGGKIPPMQPSIQRAIQRAQASPKFRRWRLTRNRRGQRVYRKAADEHPLFEKHFTPSELATLWGLSIATIRRL